MTTDTMHTTQRTRAEVRQEYLDAVLTDLMGPTHGAHEQVKLPEYGRLKDLYPFGALHPHIKPARDADEDGVDGDFSDDSSERVPGADEGTDPGEAVAMAARQGTVSMGLSFAIKVTGDSPSLNLEVSGGWYRRELIEDEDGVRRARWSRTPHHTRQVLTLPAVEQVIRESAGHDLEWYLRIVRTGETWQITCVLCNRWDESVDRVAVDEHTLFQSCVRISPSQDCEFVARREQETGFDDEDARSTGLIYRDVREWATGHGAAASWDVESEVPGFLETSWFPTQEVRAITPGGDPIFAQVSEEVLGHPDDALDAGQLAGLEVGELERALRVIPTAYTRWLDAEEERGAREPLTEQQRDTLSRHLRQAREIAARMSEGVTQIVHDPDAQRAFILAQRAMVLQTSWDREGRGKLVWRPFQLAFLLLAARGVGGDKDERELMDLLWFPTGGGKTEAYLGLAAFTIFWRRLRAAHDAGGAHDGAGVSVLMRYTLRLLTIQQFERASRVILACEALRREDPEHLGETPISIGLWVGGAATPNTLKDARDGGHERTQQLGCCPACGGALTWDYGRERGEDSDYLVRCWAPACPLGDEEPLPIYTIDEMVYRKRPTLVIGTVDKFAQIVRKGDTAALFDGPGGAPPPELIIQDELHLISGPLGTLVGLYEAAIDRICTDSSGLRPKIVGSTATIRRAERQVRALFDRKVCQFPPPVLDAENSCFARVDETIPGRTYVGVTTSGLSPKFALQFVTGALLQHTQPGMPAFPVGGDAEERDPYHTALLYFNALRELGGALVMVHDDVPATMNILSMSHGVQAREGLEHIELSSRLGSVDIPRAIQELSRPLDQEQVYSVVLATNMISVGVDITRLGLMVINGQPKSMSEYIQASSRVGRSGRAGLVWTIYNVGRARDRSHYESFRSWHQALYASVEATSVTPWSPRARDRALHACLVAIARHALAREPGFAELRDTPNLTPAAYGRLAGELERLAERGARYAGGVDARLQREIQTEGERFLSFWKLDAEAGRVTHYWWEGKPDVSLLTSAERSAGGYAGAAQATPNSMREVEPSVVFRMISGLRVDKTVE